MTKLDKAFEERLYKEYDLRGRAKLAIYISLTLYLGFLLLDWAYTPHLFREFLIIRLAVAFVHIVLLALFTRTKTNRGFINLGMTMVLADAAGICVMIQMMGGFLTSYYQGLNIIVMGMVVVIPLAFRETMILYALVWLGYALPSFVTMFTRPQPAPPPVLREWQYVINNLFFLTSIIVVGAVGSYLMDVIRRRELRSRVLLEETTSELQKSNAQLKTLDELKNQFFANVNHELRTPLTLMIAPLGPVLEGQMGPLTSSQRETFETIRVNGYRLLKLINNLLDLSKLEEGKMRLKIKTLDLNEFVAALLATVKPMADRKAIKLFFQHPPNRVEVTIDPDQFEKVVLNLLSNALKFTPDRGRITLYIEEKDETVTFAVEDTGVGVPADMRDVIFDRFRQVDGSASRAQEGTGIGLSLVREIVQLHRGRISVDSVEGHGSTFTVELWKGAGHFTEDVLDRRTADLPVPLKKRETDREGLSVHDIVSNARELQLADLDRIGIVPAAAPSDERKHDHNILVIDDNPEVLKLMGLLLGTSFDLDFATSAREGLRILAEKNPDIVLCDVMMPEMDGYQFCRTVKGDPAHMHTPVILVTARSGAEMLAEGIDAGADDYIAKPFSAVELKARVRSLLRMRQVEAELALANRNLKMRTQDLAERQRALFISMVKSLVSALEAKDIYTRHHSARVTEFSLKIARRMGFGEREMEDLELAGLLHDVGKIGVPENILNKRGPLTEEEFAAIKEHPVHAEAILRPVVELKQISKIVRSHHERYDGTGYPDRLRGLEIPLGSRIMAVADAYDAITSKRPYRGSESHAHAVKEIVRCSGKQFDPEVVQHFIEAAPEFMAEMEAATTSAL